MATQQTVEDFSDAVTCSMCFEEMVHRTPKSLPCKHTFCSQCIDSLLDTVTTDTDSDVKTISCPTCRKPAQIPGGSSTSLPSCFYIEMLDKALKVLKKSSSMCKVDDIRSDTEVDREAIKEALTEKGNSAKEELAKIDIMQKEFNEKLDMAEDKLNKHFTTSSNQLNEQYEALQLKLEDRRKDFNKNVNNAKEVIENTLNWRNPTTGISNGHLDSSRVNVPAVVEYVEKTKALDYVSGPEKLPLGDLVEIGNEEQHEPLNALYTIQDVTKVNDLDYLSNDMLVIADYDKGLQAYDTTGSPVQVTFTGKCKGDISFISAAKHKLLLLVSHKGCVEVFTADDGNWCDKTLLSGLKKDVLVALTAESDVILTDYDPIPHSFQKKSWPIQKYDINGKQIWSKQLQECATDICVDSQDRIIICHKRSLTVYDPSVKELFSIQTMDNVIPLGVCVDLQDNIVLADSNNKVVFLYNSHGKYIKTILDEEKPVLRVASNKAGHIAIDIDGKVSVFESC